MEGHASTLDVCLPRDLLLSIVSGFGATMWLEKPLDATDSGFKLGVNPRIIMASVGQFLLINSGRLHCKRMEDLCRKGAAYEILGVAVDKGLPSSPLTIPVFCGLARSGLWICVKASVIIHFRPRVMSAEESGESLQPQKVRTEQSK